MLSGHGTPRDVGSHGDGSGFANRLSASAYVAAATYWTCIEPLFRLLPRSQITVDLTIEMLLDSTCDGPAHTVENSDIDFGECCLLYGGGRRNLVPLPRFAPVVITAVAARMRLGLRQP